MAAENTKSPLQVWGPRVALGAGMIAGGTALVLGTREAGRIAGPIKGAIVPPTMDHLSPDVAEHRSLHLSHEAQSEPYTLIVVGDSMCYPNGIKLHDGATQEGTYPQLLAERQTAQGVAMVALNFATPGDATAEVLATLKREEVRQAMLTSPNAIPVVSLSGNDYRTFIDHPDIKEALAKLSEQDLTLRRLLRLPKMAIKLSRRHTQTGETFGNEFMKVLAAIERLNQERVALGNDEFKGLVVTLPPDFGHAPGIQFVPTEHAHEAVEEELFDSNQPVVRNIATLVAHTIASHSIKAFHAFNRQKSSAYAMSLLPMWEAVGAEHFTCGDQHVNDQGQLDLSFGLETAIFG